MHYEIRYQPSYSLAVVTLDTNERFRAEAGAMVSMDDSIRIETKTGGGLGSVLKRTVLGGESLFVNDMVATQPNSQVTLAPALPGDIAAVEIAAGRNLLVQSGSYLASTPEVVVDTKFGAGRSFFSGEGLFLLKLSGPGLAMLSSYGAIAMIELAAGQSHVVDTGHMVAFDEGMGYEVRKAGNSWKTTLLGGEGLVCRITGPGRFYLQTRSPGGLLDWLIPRLPTQRSS
ncbi:MAG: TIGR00266 family protein [Chloroflexota bacterium]